MPEKSQTSTRERILLTAETLFAERGVDAVSLNEINKAAGQKNTSSLHYHFGNKDGLIREIVYSQYVEIEQKLQASLAELDTKNTLSVDELVNLTLQPFFDKLATPRGVNYVLIVAQLLNKSADLLIVGHPDNLDKARVQILDIFEQIAPELTEQEKVSRLILASNFLFHSLATYAKLGQSQEPNPLGSIDDFVENFTKLFRAMIRAKS